jgi:hypothetical protein
MASPWSTGMPRSVGDPEDHSSSVVPVDLLVARRGSCERHRVSDGDAQVAVASGIGQLDCGLGFRVGREVVTAEQPDGGVSNSIGQKSKRGCPSRVA